MICKKWTFPLYFMLIIALSCILFIACNTRDSVKPNILLIMADDLGYGELGCYGQDVIQTPHIDNLARSGMRFTQFYTGAPVCAPSRCVLLTGKHTGHSYVRDNDEMREKGDVWDFQKASHDPNLEGQRPLPEGTRTIGTQLQQAGYVTACIGKWGLGGPTSEGAPNKQGFDFFYGYNCQRQAHTYYPLHLWKNEIKDTLYNRLVVPGTQLDKGADPYEPDHYKKYNQQEYAPAKMLEEALAFMDNNQHQPFFLYYATPIPHLPLQAPKEWVDKYHSILGEEAPYTGDRGYFPARYPRATYAAMISYLDDQVGSLVAKLKELGLYENTLIIFTSDNGPTYTGGADTPFFNSARPFKTEYGWGKGFTREGGIRVPMIASWEGHISPGAESNHISALWDILPTLCDVTGAGIPDDTDGISMVPELTGQVQDQHAYLYWEFPGYGGQQAVRMNDWKAIRSDIRKGNMDIELYYLKEDIQEQNNVAEQYPEVLMKMEQIMKEARFPSAVHPLFETDK